MPFCDSAGCSRTFSPTSTSISGPGIHTGHTGTVTLAELPGHIPGDGPAFRFQKRLPVLKARELSQLDFRADHGTVLRFQGQAECWTPEHLLGTLAGFSGVPVQVCCEGKEVPGLDGSGLGFLGLLKDFLSGADLETHIGFRTYATKVSKEYECEGGYFRVSPDNHFSVIYRIQVGDSCQTAELDLKEPASRRVFLDEIVPARTFATWSEFLSCLGRDMVKGACPETGILIAETKEEYEEIKERHPELKIGGYPYLNRNGIRTPDELAKHKILDLIGDLALYGLSVPRMQITIKNGGHFQNHLLLKDLLHEQLNQ